jgi:CelD/BcsL family acetyltransferase involved in cellulose biosynthesis
MKASVIRPDELGRKEISAWHSMQRKTEPLGSPFLTPEFATAVGIFRPDARVAVLTDGSEMVGFFPFQERRFGIAAPIGAGLNDCQGVIHVPGLEWDARELLRACNLSIWQFDHLAAGQLPFDQYVDAIAASPVIDLTKGFETYQTQLQAKSLRFCRDITRKARKLEREVGQLSFVIDSNDTAALRILMNWKSDQYRRNGWFDRFDRLWIVGLIDHLFSTRVDEFSGLLSLLYAGDTLVAGHFGIRFEHVLADWFPAYDTRYGKQSPGLIQNLRMLEEAASVGIDTIDLGKGTERYKQTLKTHDVFVAEGTVTRGPLFAGIVRGRNEAVKWATPKIKRHPRVFRVIDQVFRHYGRIG